MSIKPIDMMMMPPKSQEVSHQQQANQNRITHAQEQSSLHFTSEIKHNAQRTVETKRKDNGKFKYDAKEKGNNSYAPGQQKKKRDKKDEAGNEQEQGIKPGGIDIKI